MMFTSGPWEVATSELRGVLHVRTVDPQGAWICGEIYNRQMPEDEAKANAALIAAAPDLVAALESICEMVPIGSATGGVDHENIARELYRRMQIASAALARAQAKPTEQA